MGKPLPALTVMSLTIKYLKHELEKDILKSVPYDIVYKDLYTVLVVPTSFNGSGAIHFMRKATCKAGINADQFTIITDMDAASIYYHYFFSKTTSDADGKSRYMLVKAGVTTNTVVHETERYGKIEEVSQVKPSAYGSKVVDNSIENFLLELFGGKVYDVFKSTQPEDYLDFMRHIESCKSAFSLHKENMVTLRIPISLAEIYKECHAKSLTEGIKDTVYSKDVTFSRDKLRLSPKIVRVFFEQATQNVVSIVHGALEKERDNVDVLFMFGGFADMPALQDAVKKATLKTDVVIEPDASIVALKGAVIAGQSHITVKKQKKAPVAVIVVAIDFGTTYSGWALSLMNDFKSDKTKATVRKWHSDYTETEKTPTCVLIRPDGKTMEAFGYDAEDRYRDLIENGKHLKYYYFQRFIMLLNKKLGEKINRTITLEDEMGRSLPAIDVFALSIQFLKEDALSVCNKRLVGTIPKQDVHWVLTVPAIWTDGAKQFMREAAIKAGIESKRLTIALESEAASIYFRHLPVEAKVDHTSASVSSFKTGTRYMILDAGGCKIDITVHEVDIDGVKEVHSADGGGYGGTMVDKEFEKVLIALLGLNTYQRFKRQNIEDWLEVWRDFEIKKRAVSPNNAKPLRIRIPCTLVERYKEGKKCEMEDGVGKSEKYSKDIQFSGDKMTVSDELSKSFFHESVSKTKSLIKNTLEDIQITAILMVGGYSESPMLQQAIRSAFPDVKVFVPLETSYSIMKGALIFGHLPRFITKRVLRYTYGVEMAAVFVKGKHPENKRIHTDAGDRCNFLFDKHVEKGQSVSFGEPQVCKAYIPLYKQQKQIDISVFASTIPNPEYTDQCCDFVGKMSVKLGNDGDLDREVLVALTFSETEIVVEATETRTGKETYAAIDFLG